jgi:hypothetical protein
MRLPNHLWFRLAPLKTHHKILKAKRLNNEPILQERGGGLLRGDEGGVTGDCGIVLGLSLF